MRLDGVTLDWPPAHVPPLLVGARGPRTIRLAGELADGVILDSGLTPDQVRDGCALVGAARAAAGRTGPARVVVYTEIDTAGPALAARVEDRAAALGAAGADAVVFQATVDAPDPEPLIAAIAG